MKLAVALLLAAASSEAVYNIAECGKFIVGQFPGSEISGVGNSRELPGTPTPDGNSRESGRSGGSRAGAASPNPDKHFQWDWRVLG